MKLSDYAKQAERLSEYAEALTYELK